MNSPTKRYWSKFRFGAILKTEHSMKALYTILIGAVVALSACTKDETTGTGDPTTPPGGGNSTPTADYYFQGNINGTNTLIEDAKSGYIASNGSQDEGNIKRSYATLSNSGDMNSLEMLMIGDLGKSNPSNAEVYSMFSTGTQAFSNKTNDGIIINWKDASGNIWTSDTRFGGASNSSVNFETVGSLMGGTGAVKVTGTINCRVYDLSGDFKTIESGKFALLFDISK